MCCKAFNNPYKLSKFLCKGKKVKNKWICINEKFFKLNFNIKHWENNETVGKSAQIDQGIIIISFNKKYQFILLGNYLVGAKKNKIIRKLIF